MQVEQICLCTVNDDEMKRKDYFLNILKNFDWRFALVAFILSMLGPWWITYILLQKMSIARSWVFFAGSELLVNFLFLVLLTAGIHLTAGMWEGRGKVSDLFTLLCFSFLPRLVLIPLTTVLLFFPTLLAGLMFFVLMSAVVMWILLLQCKAVMLIYNFSQGQALLTVVSLPILFCGCFLVVLIFMGLGIFNVFI